MRVRSHCSEAGGALPLVLIVGGLAGVVILATLGLVHTQNRLVVRAQAWNAEIAVAEAGVEEAFVQLYYCATNLGANAWAYGDGAYVKQRPLSDDSYYLVAISNVTPPVIYSQGYVRIPGSTNYLIPRVLRITTGVNSPFRRGLSARGNVTLDGHVVVDSFDSASPDFSNNGRYDPARARDNGSVGTISTAVGALQVGNGTVYGAVATGPGGSISLGSDGAVGSRGWIQDGNHGIQSGRSSSDMNASFPDVKAPLTSAAAPGGGVLGGTNYAYVLGNGNYLLSRLTLNGQDRMLVSGNAVLYVTGDVSVGGSASINIALGASLQLYVGGSEASFAGNGILNAGGATNFWYYGLPSNTSLSLSGNAALTGVIYAPNAEFEMIGGGNNTYDCVGAAVVGSVSMNGNFNFHYDEFLGTIASFGGLAVSSWRELAGNP